MTASTFRLRCGKTHVRSATHTAPTAEAAGYLSSRPPPCRVCNSHHTAMRGYGPGLWTAPVGVSLPQRGLGSRSYLSPALRCLPAAKRCRSRHYSPSPSNVSLIICICPRRAVDSSRAISRAPCCTIRPLPSATFRSIQQVHWWRDTWRPRYGGELVPDS